MTTYVGVAVDANYSADFTAREPADHSGGVHALPLLISQHRSDGPTNAFTPNVGKNTSPLLGTLTGFLYHLSQTVHASHRIEQHAMPVGYLAFYNGVAWTGRIIEVYRAYRSIDRLTLVGRVKEQLLDLTEVPLSNVRLHFQASNIANLFGATKADDNGGYIVLLEAGEGANYDISGFRPESCKVYEVVRLDETPSATDIILRVPLACVITEEVTVGEAVDEVLNREIGHHNYEPVKTASVMTSSGAYRSGTSAPVNIAIGVSADLVNVTLTNAVAIDSIPVSSDGDAEFRLIVNGTEVVPRVRTSKFEAGGDLIGANGTIYANAGSVVRVVCLNTETGTPASSVNAQATVLGRNL